MARIGAIPSPPPKWARDIFPVTGIVNRTIELTFLPTEFSEFVILNGDTLTDGVNYDYMINDNVIVFNQDVLTPVGHVLVKYSY